MNHRPVCVKCNTEFLPEKNGVVVVDTASFGDYKAWAADMYECPICHAQIAVGFPFNAYFQHYEEGFAEHVKVMEGKGLVVRNNER